MSRKTYEVRLGKPSLARRIRDIAEANPDYGHQKIADIVGSNRSYVYIVRQNAGLLLESSAKPVVVHLERANNTWVTSEAKKLGLKMGELINVLVTDARLEQEDDS
jgi:hypothetical protein